MTVHRWHGVHFTVSIEVVYTEGEWFDYDGDPVPGLAPAQEGTEGELVLECESTGYHDPGRLWGMPEDCYPPEHEDERTVTGAELVTLGGKTSITDRETLELFGEHFETRIERQEVATDADPRDCEY